MAGGWTAVIVAAGSGKRFGSAVPKQFVELAGRKVIDWSVDAFRAIPAVDRIVVVTPPYGGDAPAYFWTPPSGVVVVPGGARRQDSVFSGVIAAEGSEFVLVHDAARPMVSGGLIERVMQGTVAVGAAIPVIPVRDTIKTVSGRSVIEETVPREWLRLSQTPQGFRRKELIAVLESAGDVTDESMAMEEAGREVLAVPGDPLNIKITSPGDHLILESLAASRTESRSGLGLDFHPFDDDVPLVLGGCRIRSERGLAGHSDGDAVLHAVIDALLSASRLGDVGVHFPPGGIRWKDADSSVLLEHVADMVGNDGWWVRQLDVTVVADEPRISPMRNEVIRRMAEILRIPPDRIWVKGTTTNSLGDIGRGKGLGCIAYVELRRSKPGCAET